MVDVDMRIRRKLAVSLLVMCALTVATPAARAQTDLAGAEALFREGMTLLDAGRYAEACPKLADSNRLDPASGTLLALALCHEKDGKTASAWAAYIEAAGLARRDGRADREASAQKHAAELEAKLSRLTINVAPATRALAGLELKRNGQLVLPSTIGTALPVDPGEQVVEATAPNREPARVTVTVAPNGDRKAIDIPELVAISVPPPPPPAPAPTPPPDEASEGMHPRRTVGFIVGGVGLASLAVGGLFGLQAMSKADDSRERCPTSRCSSRDAIELNDDAGTAATLSNVFVGIGAVGLAAGAFLVLTAPSRAKTGSLHVDVALGRVSLGGRF